MAGASDSGRWHFLTLGALGKVAVLEQAARTVWTDMLGPRPILLEAGESGLAVKSSGTLSSCLPSRPFNGRPCCDPQPSRIYHTLLLNPIFGIFLFPCMTPDSSLPETSNACDFPDNDVLVDASNRDPSIGWSSSESRAQQGCT
jgi:hypothetical protein